MYYHSFLQAVFQDTKHPVSPKTYTRYLFKTSHSTVIMLLDYGFVSLRNERFLMSVESAANQRMTLR